MKKSNYILAIFIVSALTISCKKKKETTPKVEDCVANHYGTITLNYTDLSDRHSVIITKYTSGEFYREKTVNAGVSQDTIHLFPGRYLITCDRINSKGESIENFPGVDKSPVQCGNIILDTKI